MRQLVAFWFVCIFTNTGCPVAREEGCFIYSIVVSGFQDWISVSILIQLLTVTRSQTVTFLYRAAGTPAVSGGSFADVDANAYYADAVAWAVAEGITSGTSLP